MADLDAFLAAVRATLDDAQVVTDPDVQHRHVVDWTGRWQGATPAVLRPGTVDEVVAIVRAARAHRVALVPQGGNTGLVGGSVPLGGEVVVDLRALATIGPVEVAAAQVTVGAGVTLEALQDRVRPHGLMLGVDLAARGTATLGGLVATNAGGLHVVRHGSMRAQVLGVQAVLGTGELVEVNLAGLLKDNTGYDLAGLLCGSEGTLGIVTAVRVRLVAVPAARAAVLVGFASVDAAVASLPSWRALPSLHAVELVFRGGLDVVAAHLGETAPIPAATCALLVEVAGEPSDLLEQLGGALEALGGAVVDSAAASDPAGVDRLWRWREAHSEAAASLGLVHKADVTLPHAALPAFAAEVPGVVEAVAPASTTLVYGHLADGNLHVNVVGPAADDDGPIDAVLALVLRHGGSVSAEHGIGRAKRAWLVSQRGEAAVEAMRAIKAALDPDGVLNPGVLLP